MFKRHICERGSMISFETISERSISNFFFMNPVWNHDRYEWHTFWEGNNTSRSKGVGSVGPAPLTPRFRGPSVQFMSYTMNFRAFILSELLDILGRFNKATLQTLLPQIITTRGGLCRFLTIFFTLPVYFGDTKSYHESMNTTKLWLT